MNVEGSPWTAPDARHGTPLGAALRTQLYAYDHRLPAELEQLLHRLGDAGRGSRASRQG